MFNALICGLSTVPLFQPRFMHQASSRVKQIISPPRQNLWVGRRAGPVPEALFAANSGHFSRFALW